MTLKGFQACIWEPGLLSKASITTAGSNNTYFPGRLASFEEQTISNAGIHDDQ